MLATTSLLVGVGLEESHDFCLLCVDLHTIFRKSMIPGRHVTWLAARAGKWT